MKSSPRFVRERKGEQGTTGVGNLGNASLMVLGERTLTSGRTKLKTA